MGQSGGPWAWDIPVTTFPASESLSLSCPILTCSHITGCETLTVLAFDVCFWYSLGKIQNGGKLYFPLIEKKNCGQDFLNIRPHGPYYGAGFQGGLRSPEPMAWNYSIKLYKKCKAETLKSFFFFTSSWYLFQEHTVFPKDSCSLVKLVYGSNSARSVTVPLWCPDKSLRVERRRDGRRSRLFKGDRRSAESAASTLTHSLNRSALVPFLGSSQTIICGPHGMNLWTGAQSVPHLPPVQTEEWEPLTEAVFWNDILAGLPSYWGRASWPLVQKAPCILKKRNMDASSPVFQLPLSPSRLKS